MKTDLMRTGYGLWVSCVLLLSGAAQAQAPATIDGSSGPGRSVRFGLETTLFAESDLSNTSDALGATFERSSTSAGVTQLNGLGPVLQFAVGKRALVGGRAVVSHQSDLLAGEELSSTRILLLPSAEYLFEAGPDVRLFAGGAMGMMLAFTDVGATELTQVTFAAGPQVGLHYFITDNLSLDPSLSFLYQVGNVSTESSFGDGIDTTVTGYEIGVMVGISGWQ